MTYLYEATDIDRIEVLRASTDAANEHGRILALTLSEHGISVQTEATT
jgi:hypothetical protein